MKIDLTFDQELTEKPPKYLWLYGLEEYIDKNFTRDPEDWRLIIAYYFFLNTAVVSWSSKKKKTVFILTIKAKYIALRYTTKKVIKIKKVINKIKLEVVKNFILYEDNNINIALTKNAKRHHQKSILMSSTIISES